MKILLLSWNRQRKGNWGHELWRRELAKYHTVAFYGIDYYCNYNPKTTISDIFKSYGKPDIILIHVEHRERLFPLGIIDALGKMNDIFKVHYCGDYERRNWRGYNKHFRKIKYDLIFVPVSQVLTDLKKHKIGGKHYLLPHGVDTSIFYNQHLEKTIDVATPISINERCRIQLKDFIKELGVRTKIKTLIGCISKEGYVKRINESKIIVTCSAIYGALSFKYPEVMACGTLIMGDKAKDFDRLGYKDGEHLILYDGFKDLEDKIHYFLKHDQEREQIAENGMRFVREHFSFRTQIKRFTRIVRKETRRKEAKMKKYNREGGI